MWTLAEASVECRVMSGATATDADDAGHAEERKCARGRDVAEVRDLQRGRWDTTSTW